MKKSQRFNCTFITIIFLLFFHATNAQTVAPLTEKHTDGIMLEEFIYKRADFPQCHAASLIELKNADLLCTFFGGTYERHPDVEIKISRKKSGGDWSKPISVADGIQTDGTRFPTWNPVLFQPKGGTLMLFYKVGPNPTEWWGEYKTSDDNGEHWSTAIKLELPILGPIKNKPIQLADGSILSSSSSEDKDWLTHIERSTDDGKSWTFIGPLNNPKKIQAIQPTLLTYADGSIQLLARTSTKDAVIAESWTNDGGLTWSPMKATILPNNNSGLDAVSLKDGRQMLIYNHSTKNQKRMGHKGRGVINIAVTKDGKNWDAALVLDYIDAPEKHYSYPAIIQTEDGLVHVVYTWHRTRIKHVVIDPEKLKTYPIINGKWPYKDIPMVISNE